MGASHDGDEDANLYRPNAWKVALEATYKKPAPSSEIKAAADQLVSAELVQQGTGWLLLTLMGLLLGSNGQLLPVKVCMLSLGILMLEAILKYSRNWAHQSFFMDVPCVYVPLHEATREALSSFENLLKSALIMELCLYGPYTYYAIQYFIDTRVCEADDSDESEYCQAAGDKFTVWLTLFCSAVVLLHGAMSLRAWRAFNVAMGFSVADGAPYQRQPRRKSPRRSPWDRVLCVTWWVHLARHRHLSAVVASKEPTSCGLPGHWFETVGELKMKLGQCVMNGTGDHVLSSEGPLWDSLNMALGAIICLARPGEKKVCREILSDDGYNLLVRVVREGKFASSRGLAAAAVGVLANCQDAVREEEVDLSAAVIPLKRLARSKEHELKEAALGALLNIVLNDDQLETVLKEFGRKDVLKGKIRKDFIYFTLDHAFYGPTTRCQELAIGLLAKLAGHSEDVRNALMDKYPAGHRACGAAGVGNDVPCIAALEQNRSGQVGGGVDLGRNGNGFRSAHVLDQNRPWHGGDCGGISRMEKLLRHGLTAEIKASAAWVLAELAFKNSKTMRNDPAVGTCIEALIYLLEREPRVVYASTRAVYNLAQLQGVKKTIVAKGGVMALVQLLKYEQIPSLQEQSLPLSQRETANPITQEQVRAEAARVLSTFCIQNKDYQQLIADSGAIPPLVDVLESSDPKVYMHAVSALAGIVSNNTTNQDRICSCGARVFSKVVQILQDKVRENSLDEKGFRKINMAIVSFAKNHRRNREMLIEYGAATTLQDIVRNSKQGRAVPKAKEALQTLTESSTD